MRSILLSATALFLSGCVVQPPEPPPPIDPAAVCYSKPQCDAMWSEAMVQLQNLSGMRLQTATETYIQTYNTNDFNRMTASARKIPKPDGSTVIDANFSCGYCGNLVYRALNLFTGSVKYAGQGFVAPDQPAAAQAPRPEPEPTPNVSADDYRKAFSALGVAR